MESKFATNSKLCNNSVEKLEVRIPLISVPNFDLSIRFNFNKISPVNAEYSVRFKMSLSERDNTYGCQNHAHHWSCFCRKWGHRWQPHFAISWVTSWWKLGVPCCCCLAACGILWNGRLLGRSTGQGVASYHSHCWLLDYFTSCLIMIIRTYFVLINLKQVKNNLHSNYWIFQLPPN